MSHTEGGVRKAFAYLRISGKSRVAADSFPRQLEAIKDYAKAQKIGIVHVYEEKGIPGAKDWEYRPKWMAMMAAAPGGGVKTVIVEKLDRLAHSLMMQETLIGDLRKHGLEPMSVHEPDLLQSDRVRVLLREMMGTIADCEKAVATVKSRGAGNRAKAAGGRASRNS